MSEVITLKEIEQKAKGTIVEIPDWEPGKKIKVRLRAIDLTPHLLKAGVLPNDLKVTATEVFEGKREPEEAVDIDIERMMPILDAVAKEALAEPKFDEIQKLYPLTLNQKLAILDFVMGEIEGLKSFRGQPSDDDGNDSGSQNVRGKAELTD